MKRERLTNPRIDAFACPPDKQQVFLWDTVSPRLAVRATAGAKAFIFEGKLNRQTIRRTIGSTRVWLLDDARAEANRLQALLDRGEDPREIEREQEAQKVAKKAAKEAAQREAEDRQRYTLHALCNAYADHLERLGKTRSAAAARSAFKCHVFSHPKIARLPAREVTARQMAELVRKTAEAGKGRTAGIVRAYLCAAFNAAKKAPLSATLPADLIPFDIGHNPVLDVPAIPVTAGNRTLSADELKAYMAHLGDALPDQALLLALLAGGQRMAQLLRAKVADYDEPTQTLRLWDSKGKRKTAREHLLPLAPRAAALVGALVDRAREIEAPRLFAARRETLMAVETPGKRAAEISAAMGGEPFDLRDMRRTVETMLAGLGISRDTRAQLLSHGISGVQAAHYDRHAYTNEKRAALAAWEARLEEIATGKKADNVVKMRKKSKTVA